ncbi:MAG: ATP-binding protein [Thermomicrobiales bacterium]
MRLRPRRPALPIRARIAFYGSVVVALTLLFFSLLVYLLAERGGANDIDNALRDRAEAAAASLAEADPDLFTPRRSPAPIDLRHDLDPFVVILDGDGQPISSTGELDGAMPTIDRDLLSDAADGATKTTTALAPGVEVRLVVLPWSRPDLGLTGYVVTGQSARRHDQDIAGIVAFLVLSATVSLLAAFGASWRVAGRALRPLRSMATTVDAIDGADDLSRRLPLIRARDEIGRLTDSFNAMLARLDETHADLRDALDREHRFVADASHELRTPLTSIRANADFLIAHFDAAPVDRAAAVADIAAESERMTRLVHDLLTLARADAGFHLHKTSLDPRIILDDVWRQARRLHPARDVAMELPAPSAAIIVHGDEDALRRLVWILVDNALRHGGPTAHVRLRLTTEDDRAQIRVADAGPGLPPDALKRAFERFYQADPSRGGSGVGLGLAIARWIAEDHGGTIRAYNNADAGASFIVDLPLADEGHS